MSIDRPIDDMFQSQASRIGCTEMEIVIIDGIPDFGGLGSEKDARLDLQ
ncbi:MAG: hypothetical protein QXM12_07110 [Nitrososphaerota archaeon]